MSDKELDYKVVGGNVTDLVQDLNNANLGTEAGQRLLDKSIQETGAGRSVVVDSEGRIIGGNKTHLAAIKAGITDTVIVKTNGEALIVHQREDLNLADDDPNNPARLLAYLDNTTSDANLNFDPAVLLADAAAGVDLEFVFDEQILEDLLDGFDADALLSGSDGDGGEGGESGDEIPEAESDKAEELAQEYGVELGQVWVLDSGQGMRHRLGVGDCRDGALLGRLFEDGESKAAIGLQDPPYGMGKEKDGVANDNLYREKLDGFIMECWEAGRPYLMDNASVYIFGNAPDLWRLWYVGGLKDSERLTFRNEIVWDKANESGKYDGNGIGSSIGRQYARISERCLFFMIGEQGFNENADNYWEGWEPIRLYLKGEREKMGWDIPTMKRIVGHSDLSRDHWTSKSQWSFPTCDVYTMLQKGANGQAFKREYEELKREFYSTRAYFDNTHELMTDVWSFPRVTGYERHEHATPKPLELIKRIIKSSSREGDIVYSPFGGTGTDLVSSEALGRSCYTVELLPKWVGVILSRWETMTGCKAALESSL